MEIEEQSVLTLRDYLKVIFRHKSVMVVSFVTVMATVYIGLQFQTPVYESQVKMLISAAKQVESPYYKDLMGLRQSEVALTQSEIVKSSPVIERVVRGFRLYQRPIDYERQYCSKWKIKFVELKAKQFEDQLKTLKTEQKEPFLFRLAVRFLKGNVKVEPIRDTDLFVIKVRDYSQVAAAILANAISRSYVIFDLEQQLAEVRLKYGENHPIVKQLSDNIDLMTKTLNGEPLPNVEAIGPASVKIIEQAEVAFNPVGVSKPMILALGLFMSIFLGVVLSFIFDYLDQSFKSPRDVELFLGFNHLGSIPRLKFFNRKVVSGFKRETSYTRAYRNISEQVYLLMKDKKMKSAMFTSVLPKEDIGHIIVNLALYMSQKQGHKVLLIDANLRETSMERTLKVIARSVSRGKPVVSFDKHGLAEVLENKAAFKDTVYEMSHKFSVLPAGRTELNPITLLESSAMAEVIKKADEDFDIVLVSCVNLRDFKDGFVLSPSVDGVVLVVNEGKSRRGVVKQVLKPFESNRSRILGVILNNRTFVLPKLIYDRV